MLALDDNAHYGELNIRALFRTDETIAWASAQVHCFCSVNDSRVILPASLLKNKVAKAGGGLKHKFDVT